MPDRFPRGAGLDPQALYQELILDHYRRPRNRGPAEPGDASVTRHNPLCGEALTVSVAVAGDRVRAARFTGDACSISTAAASMMTQAVAGRTRAEATALARRFRAMIAGDAAAATDSALGEMRALSGVGRLPARRGCALLPWDALEAALRGEAARG
ncbi:MAG TPA: SUF system NifU family Fe-S cluster assembly protein [Gemmatimonadaceae bacterium]|nr:SUF system NifU family Fe-S cluster assembly protein [Gemmatimonadaceae bacterium]